MAHPAALRDPRIDPPTSQRPLWARNARPRPTRAYRGPLEPPQPRRPGLFNGLGWTTHHERLPQRRSDRPPLPPPRLRLRRKSTDAAPIAALAHPVRGAHRAESGVVPGLRSQEDGVRLCAHGAPHRHAPCRTCEGAGRNGRSRLARPRRSSVEIGMRVHLEHFASGEESASPLEWDGVEPESDHITVTVECGGLVFKGAGRLPDCDLDAGLIAVLESLRDQGWEIDPDQSRSSGPVLLRRKRVTARRATRPLEISHD